MFRLKNDPMYLHMVIPSSDELTNEEIINVNINEEKKIYYEVGCKIFEINKVYK